MRVLLFGATGMVGQGVLLSCLAAPDVDEVLVVGRVATGQVHPKLRELIRSDLFQLGDVADRLQPFDACFFCLGVSSFRMSETEYSRLTYDLTIAIAERLAPRNPRMTFVYVSGANTDGSERGKSMWARVKGRTENTLQRLPFKAVYLFRPGVMKPVDGTKSKTPVFNVLYPALRPFIALVQWLSPDRILTTEGIGVAMLEVARHGHDGAIVESDSLKALVRRARSA